MENDRSRGCELGLENEKITNQHGVDNSFFLKVLCKQNAVLFSLWNWALGAEKEEILRASLCVCGELASLNILGVIEGEGKNNNNKVLILF